MKRIISFLLMISLCCSFPVYGFAKTSFHEDSDAIAEAAESVLLLTCYDKKGNTIATGSGFLAIEDGIILTNYHVIDGVDSIMASTEDGMFFAIDDTLCFDIEQDIAILKTNAKTRLPLLTLGDSDNVKKGSKVVAIGSPLGLLNIVTEGIYSGIFVDDNTRRILFSASISSGSSGGALFDEDGKVIGITCATYTEGQNLNLAVPINDAIELWEAHEAGNWEKDISSSEPASEKDSVTPEEIFASGKEAYDNEQYSLAFEKFLQAAEFDYSDAQYYVGLCYFRGVGVAKDDTKAVEWFKKAAEQKHVKAQAYLGVCYYYGFGTQQNTSKGIDLLKTALDQNDRIAQYFLGEFYLTGESVNEDINLGIELIKKSAEQDLSLAQDLLGDLYYYGEGVLQDYNLAVEYYLKAAEQGDYEAQNMLGVCYANGTGVKQDYKAALKWYQKSADQGYDIAQCNLAYLYYNGQGVNRDYKNAFKWFSKAAVQDNIWAQYELGMCYYTGSGVDGNIEEAVKWFKKAADSGNMEAQFRLGECYLYGYGVTKNITAAIEWYTKAAQQGHDRAQRALARIYGN